MTELIENLHFLRPLWFIAMIPALAVYYLVFFSNRISENWERVCDPSLLPHIISSQNRQYGFFTHTLILLTLILIITALAGPVWQKLPANIYRSQSALVVILDLSQSMNADDIKPSRLERARYKLIDLLQTRQEGETALVVYAGDAFTVTPLTTDTRTIRTQLSALETGLMPIQGARADIALLKASELLKQAGRKQGDILLMTDEVNVFFDIQAAEKISEQGYRISVLSIGTKEGAPIKLDNGGFLKDRQGDIVIPKVKAEAMQAVADAGKGIYLPLSVDDTDLKNLESLLAVQPQQSELEQVDFKTDQWREEGPLLLLCVMPVLMLLFRRGLVFGLVFFLMPLANNVEALEWDALWLNENQLAEQQYNSGNFQSAAEQFTDPGWRAAASYRAGDYENAVSALEGLNDIRSQYNRGNALAKLGQIDEAIHEYEKVLEQNPQHHAARENLELLRQMKQQQQNQQSDQGEDNQSSDEQQQSDNESDEENGDQGEQQQQDNPSSASHSSDPGNSGTDSASNRPAQANDSDFQNEQINNDRNSETGDNQQNNSADDEDNKTGQARIEPETQQKDKQQNEQALEQLAGTSDKPPAQDTEQEDPWLQRVPDDPGGLLRRKFLYQYRQSANRNNPGDKNW